MIVEDATEEINLTLCTLLYRLDYIHDRKCPKKIEITPIDQQWTYSLLSAFLNDLTNFTVGQHSFLIKQAKYSKTARFCFHNINNNEWIIYITINDEIKVRVSTKWLLEDWDYELRNLFSNLGSENKILKKAKMNKHIRFYKIFNNLKSSSKYFIDKTSLIYFSKYDFSHILHNQIDSL